MVRSGDRVKLILKDNSRYEGVLMPSPEALNSKAVVIKLNSGYNIGISKSRISRIRLVKKSKIIAEKKKKLKKKKGLPAVTILSTGGTISSRVDYKTGGVCPNLIAEDFVEAVPELSNYANITAREILKVPSEDLTPKDWIKLAKEVSKEIKKKVDGIVITHGTDTMHYSSAALALMLQNLPIPVVFVGSQRSADRGSSDAFSNLLAAVITAARWDGAESVICMHETSDDISNIVIRGTKARKMHTERRDAFRPINSLPLARVGYKGGIINLSEFRKRSDSKPVLNTNLDTKVAFLHVYPGMNPELIENMIKKEYHGIVLAGTGLGHVPKNLHQIIKKAIKKDIAVVMTSQCLYGRTHKFVYSPLRRLWKMGVIFAEDMLPEVAYIKLMQSLAKTRKLDELRELMEKNEAGEITECTAPEGFLV
ncbi:MAG TPA: Glu-tRNA(Gln) amidotransferase subunit GatD [Candidatus Woesearchaeota archaeon]|nr:Glu-tRNA(Gln) amidotransferase subunit GatD [Candidatus Woesearchaeota archaeon]